MVKYRVEVDRATCQGFGACVELCPGSFYLSEEDGKTRIRGAQEVIEVGGSVREVIEVDALGCFGQAADACPFRAIRVVRA